MLSVSDYQKLIMTVFTLPRFLLIRQDYCIDTERRGFGANRKTQVTEMNGRGTIRALDRSCFFLDGIRSTCFICADGDSARCITRAKLLRPEVAFYPNNRATLPDFDVFGQYARAMGAILLVTNRTGRSWIHECKGGSVVYSANGDVLAYSNRDGREEILIYDIHV